MKILAVLTNPKVVDRIIRHLDINAVTPRSPPPMSTPLDPTLPSHDNLYPQVCLPTTQKADPDEF